MQKVPKILLRMSSAVVAPVSWSSGTESAVEVQQQQFVGKSGESGLKGLLQHGEAFPEQGTLAQGGNKLALEPYVIVLRGAWCERSQNGVTKNGDAFAGKSRDGVLAGLS